MKDLTKGSPMRVLLSFSLSMLVSSILSYVYSATDSAMVGHYVDKHALGAINSITPVTTMIQYVILALLSGFTISISRSFGKGNLDKTRRLTANSVTLAATIVIPTTVISCVLVSQVVSMMNVPIEFTPNATAYYLIVIAALPITAINSFCSGVFNAFGDSRTPMIISISSGALNVLFNYLLLAVIPLGVAGAAIGTVCAAFVGTVVQIVLLARTIPQIRFRLRDMRLCLGDTKELLSDGISIAMLNLVVTAGSVILQRAINSFAPAVITGVAAGSQITRLIWMILAAVESALVYYCSQNYGSGNISRVKKGMASTAIIMLVGAGAFVLASFLCGEPLVRIFLGSDTDADTLATVGESLSFLRIQLVFFPIMILLCSLRGAVKGIGLTLPTVICGVMELVVRLVASALSTLTNWGTEVKIGVLYLAGPASWLGAAVVLAFILPRALRKGRDNPHDDTTSSSSECEMCDTTT